MISIRGKLVNYTCPACDEMNTILPFFLSIIAGRRAWVGKMDPRTFTVRSSCNFTMCKKKCHNLLLQEHQLLHSLHYWIEF
jgi:hypothetical protein